MVTSPNPNWSPFCKSLSSTAVAFPSFSSLFQNSKIFCSSQCFFVGPRWRALYILTPLVWDGSFLKGLSLSTESNSLSPTLPGFRFLSSFCCFSFFNLLYIPYEQQFILRLILQFFAHRIVMSKNLSLGYMKVVFLSYMCIFIWVLVVFL